MKMLQLSTVLLVSQLLKVHSSVLSISLDGKNAYDIMGAQAGEVSGWSVSSAGDFNGDGYDDIIIGAPEANYYEGKAYIVFGIHDMTATGINLAIDDEAEHIVIFGEDGVDYSGCSVSGGFDFNNDGYDDVIIGAYGASGNTGKSYVLFGGTDVGSSGYFYLSDLNGVNGFEMTGVSGFDYTGFSVSGAGDFNNDGYDDILIGAYAANVNGYESAGKTYLVYGSMSMTVSSIDLGSLTGLNGFSLLGAVDNARSGYSVSGGFDFNRDGYDDILIGAYGDYSYAGAGYIVYGGSNVGSSGSITLDTNTLDGLQGFIIQGISSYDQVGYSVSSAGDFNHDGYDDVILGAIGVSVSTTASTFTGSSYVVFGGSKVGTFGRVELSSLDENSCIVITGESSDDKSGFSVSSAGDVNGDGYDDVIIGAPYYNVNQYGAAYVVYGGKKLSSPINLIDLSDPTCDEGLVVYGLGSSSNLGHSVSGIGDTNGDGYDDFIIGAPSADMDHAGISYVFTISHKHHHNNDNNPIIMYVIIFLVIVILFLGVLCYKKYSQRRMKSSNNGNDDDAVDKSIDEINVSGSLNSPLIINGESEAN